MTNGNELQNYLDYDLDEGAQATDQERSKADSSASIFFSPSSGENVLRILPPPMAWSSWYQEQNKKPDPFFILWKHFYERPDDPGQYISVPCPKKNAGKPCPICDEVAKLKGSQDPLDRELADDMEAKHRFLVNVINRDNEDAGALIYEGSYPFRRWKGKSAYEKIRALMVGRARVNLVTPGPTGYDLIIKKEGKGRQGTSYTFQSDRDPSPLNADPALAMTWINDQHDLREYVALPTPNQMAAVILGEAMSPMMLNPDGSKKELGDGGGNSGQRGTSGGGRAPSRRGASHPPEESAGDFIDAAVVSDDDELVF
jgi:hypothetical protein